jgi:hypothetical protein
MDSGDILRVKETKATKLYCENISLKSEYRQEIIIDKLDVLQQSFKIIERQSIRLKDSIDKLNLTS